MIVKVDWTNGVTSTFTNIHPVRNRADDGNTCIIHSKDGKVTRDIYCDKVNYISFTEEPDDVELLRNNKQPRYTHGPPPVPSRPEEPEHIGQPSPYST